MSGGDRHDSVPGKRAEQLVACRQAAEKLLRDLDVAELMVPAAHLCLIIELIDAELDDASGL